MQSVAKSTGREIWKPFREGIYEVSSLGMVRRAKLGFKAGNTSVGRVRKVQMESDGYYHVRLSLHGKGYHFTLAQVVAETFLGPCPPGKQVNHKDGVKLNNAPSNLEYVTPRENIAHAIRLGLFKTRRGEANSGCKLTEVAVLAIRKFYVPYLLPMRKLAEMFGVSPGTVDAVIRGKTWVHVGGRKQP